MVNMKIDVKAEIHNSTEEMESRKWLISEASNKSHFLAFSFLKMISRPAKKISNACGWIFDHDFHIG